MPDSAEYLACIQSLISGDDILAVQQQTSVELQSLIAGIAQQALYQKPAPGKWSVVEIVAHMAEDELVSSWRYRQMLERDGCKLSGFDQDLWARLGNYISWSIDDALRMFTLLRDANLRMLTSLQVAVALPWSSHRKRKNHSPRPRHAHGRS